MAIAFVNSGVNQTTNSFVSSLGITYTPTAGNWVIVIAELGGGANTPFTCKDNNNNALTLYNNMGAYLLFYGQATSGATSYTVNWATNTAYAAVVLLEYSGVGGIGVTAFNNGSNSTATISITTSGPNSWMIVNFCNNIANTVFTGSLGNLRAQQQTTLGSTPSICGMDNTTASSGATLTATATTSNANWLALALELLPAGQDSYAISGDYAVTIS